VGIQKAHLSLWQLTITAITNRQVLLSQVNESSYIVQVQWVWDLSPKTARRSMQAEDGKHSVISLYAAAAALW